MNKTITGKRFVFDSAHVRRPHLLCC